MAYIKIKPSIRVSDLDGVAKEIINYIDGQDITPYPDYEVIVAELKTQQIALSAAINREVDESTQAECDEQRDEWVSAISITLQAGLVSPVEAQVTAAQAVWKVFNKYGAKITYLNYSAKSAQINSLLTDFDNPELADSIAGVANMSTFIANLRVAQAAFEEAEIAYDASRTMLKKSDSASRVKPKVIEAVGNLVDFHNALVRFKDTNFEHICDIINTIIEEANMLIKTRATKKEEEE